MVERLDGMLVYTQVNTAQLENIKNQQDKIVEAQKQTTKDIEEAKKTTQAPKPGDLTEIIEEPVDAIKNMNVKRLYDVDDLLNLVIISVLKPETNKLVRQIPSEVSVDIAKYLSKYIGRNVNTEA
jgi:uncharacterized FlaG/YvyC family protein